MAYGSMYLGSIFAFFATLNISTPCMKYKILFVSLLLCSTAFAQQKTYLRVNLPALIMGSYEVSLERHLSDISALELGIGFRHQRLDSGETASFQSLARFRGLRNHSLAGTIGIRFFEDNPYEHPFIAFHLTGVYYEDRIETTDAGIQDFKGFRLGGAVTLGFTFPMGERLGLDVAMQLGYTKPRERPEPSSYYFPGLGFVVADFNILSIAGAHFQPIFALRYKIQRSRRDRIRN